MLNIALPKGRLGEQVYEAFERAGFPCPSIREDSRKLISNTPTTLYVYKNEASGRIVVIGLVQYEGLSQAVVSYTK